MTTEDRILAFATAVVQIKVRLVYMDSGLLLLGPIRHTDGTAGITQWH